MDEEDEFDSFEIDQDVLDQIDALERGHQQQKGSGSKEEANRRKAGAEPSKSANVVDDEDDEFGMEWNDSSFLDKVQEVEKQHQQGGSTARTPARMGFPVQKRRSQPTAGSSSRREMPSSSSSNGVGAKPRQRNLFGEVVQVQASQGMLLAAAPKAHSSKATASQMHNLMTNPNHRFSVVEKAPAKRKEWNRDQPSNKEKQKASSIFLNDDEDDDEDEVYGNWDLGDDDFVNAPPPPLPDVATSMKVQIDREEAKKWIYPTNMKMRDYQYNIVQRALFNNVLVALPTGLGKTFIAAVVILNYFRWFPTGKIIFVAPTKPLVAQQQQACHGICGLPWDCAVEMTGGTKASLRGDEWKTKRIFYMTPQTFENDLCSTAVNAEDVVCVVVDEAHRATGNYAYCKVIQWITARNPFFRVLALTATPGNKPDKVQEVIDNLHINLIEIRTEEAADIRKYVHTKKEDPVVVPLGGVVAEMRDLLAKVMRPSLEILNQNGLTHIKDPCSFSSFTTTLMYKDAAKRRLISERKLFNHVTDLGAMARAMEYLVKYSVHMFYRRVVEMQSGTSDKGKKAATTRQKNKFQNNSVIQEIERLYVASQDSKGRIQHPKMGYLQNTVAAHFADEEEHGRKEDTRIMVFCQFRECVNEIVEILGEQEGIRPTEFVGQSSDNQGNKGMTQKEQEAVVRDFKSGKYNVLIATSIGEEGLDIGEVDLIVCFEAVKNSVRMLQRIGRTGRKRDGRIVVLMSEGPEEKNWEHSKESHKSIQNELMNGSHLELFDDVERLVPEDITSVAVMQEVEQPPFEPNMVGKPGRQKKIPKAKKNSDPYRNVPDEGFKGFIKVSDMKKKPRKARKSDREGDSEASASDSQPSGLSLSVDVEEQKAPQKKLCLSDDSDDEQLERGIVIAAKTPVQKVAARPILTNSAGSSSRKGRLGAGRAPRKIATPQSTDSRASASSHMVAVPLSSSPPVEGSPPLQIRNGNVQAAFNVSDEDGDISDGKTDSTISSPIKGPKRRAPHPLIAKLAAQLGNISDDSEKEEEEVEEGDEVEEEEEEDKLKQNRRKARVVPRISSSPVESPIVSKRGRTKEVRRKVVRLASSSPVATMGPPSAPASTKRKKELKPKKDQSEKKENKRKIIGASPTSRRLFQYEADRSTDEEIHGERDENDEGRDSEEDSSDLEHVGDFMPTQAPKGYNQNAIYLQSLLSQDAVATPFRRPAKSRQAGGFQMGLDSEQVRRFVQDTPNRRSELDSGSEEDDYEVGSFVCSDDELVFDTQHTSSQSVLVD
jgi:ERCC4-related helicase